jgi:uronate dehydrogenase
VRPWLRDRYHLRLLDRVPVTDAERNESVIHGDLVDASVLAEALDGVYGVLHLACVHGYGITFEETLDVNYRSMLALLEGSVRAGVQRFVYTSSHHVLGQHPIAGFAGDHSPLAPDGFYGLSKAFGEAACALYTQRSALRTLVIRVGNADPIVGDARRMRLWTSSRDLASLIDIGLTHPQLEFEVVYGVSASSDPLFPNSRAHELGYRPLDHTGEHIAADYAPYELMLPESGRDFVGGPYAAFPLPPTRNPCK